MTRIHFYHLSGGQGTLASVIARLVIQARRRRLDALVKVESESAAADLGDRLRQLFTDGTTISMAPDLASPVVLTWTEEPGPHHGLLINTAAGVPDCFSRFERLAELVYDHPGLVADKRDNFRYYRERGYPLHYHDLSQQQTLLESA